MAWRASEQATFDLQKIAEQGITNFGFRHTQDYLSSFLDMFDTLAAQPRMAGERQAAASRVRLMPFGAHNILYVIEDEDVVIVRVLHGLQNWFELL